MKLELSITKEYRKKSQLPDAAKALFEMVENEQKENGAFSFAEAYVEAKYRSEFYIELLKLAEFKDAVIQEIDKETLKNRDNQTVLKIANTFEVTKSSTGDRYSFDHDEVWNRHADEEAILKQKMAAVTKLKKEREDYLKVLSKQQYSKVNADSIAVDGSTGEKIKGAKLMTPAKPIVRVKY